MCNHLEAKNIERTADEFSNESILPMLRNTSSKFVEAVETAARHLTISGNDIRGICCKERVNTLYF
jgi:hypothetical protein